MGKIAAKWVRHELTAEQNCTRHAAFRLNLERYETKQTTWWRESLTLTIPEPGSMNPSLNSILVKDNPKDRRQNPSPLKLMVILSYDIRGIPLCHFLPHRQNVMQPTYYVESLQNNLRRAIGNKRPNLLQNAIFLHENATAHKKIVWRIFYCTEDEKYYSIHSRTFTKEYIANAVRREIARLDNVEAGGIRCIPHRWQRTIACFRDYFQRC